MLKHATVLVAATASALAAAQGLLHYSPKAAAAESQPAALAQPLQTDQAAEGAAPAQVSKGRDGHFWAEAEVNGRWVRFLVDTGASAVALTRTDAERLGLDVEKLDYARPVVTAHGATQAAAVTLDRVSVAGARVDHVDALVVRDGLSTSLLGMSYLGRLSRFEATRTALILRP